MISLKFNLKNIFNNQIKNFNLFYLVLQVLKHKILLNFFFNLNFLLFVINSNNNTYASFFNIFPLFKLELKTKLFFFNLLTLKPILSNKKTINNLIISGWILKNFFDFFGIIFRDLVVCDRIDKQNIRFEINYLFLILKQRSGFNVKFKEFNFKLDITKNYVIPSFSKMFDSALALERENWDMFGIKFKNNTDLRRILTDYGFKGHPLRKDFPLVGFRQVCYDSLTESTKYVPNFFSQEFREFRLVNPWKPFILIKTFDLSF